MLINYQRIHLDLYNVYVVERKCALLATNDYAYFVCVASNKCPAIE